MHTSKQADLKSDVTLQPHQKRVMDRFRDNPGRVMLMHALGSGKTLTGIGTAEQLGDPYTFIAPASLRDNARKELEKFTTDPSMADVVSYSGLAKGKPIPNSQSLIADEAHRLRNPAAMQTQRFMDLARRAKQVTLMTGTPIVNDPSDLAVPMSVLTGKDITPKEFHDRYVGSKKVSPGLLGWLRGIPSAKEPVINHPDELRSLLKGHVDYYSPDHGTVPTTQEDVPVEMSPDQTKLYHAMWGQLPWLTRWKLKHNYPLEQDELKRMTSFLVGPRQVGLSTYTFMGAKRDPLKAFTGSTKLQEAYKRLNETLKDQRTKALVFSNFIDAGLTPYAAGLAAAGIPHGVFHGGLNDKERKKLVDDFNSNRIRVALLGPSGAEGLSFKGTQLVQLLDPYWNSVRGRQSQGRALRYDSHWDLPEELQNVKVQRFMSKLPLGFKDRLLERVGFDRTLNRRATDDYLDNMAGRKDKLNQQFIDVLKEVGSQKSGADTEYVGGTGGDYGMAHAPLPGDRLVAGDNAEHGDEDIPQSVIDDEQAIEDAAPVDGLLAAEEIKEAEEQAKNWVRKVMTTSFATDPPKKIFTQSPEEIAGAMDIEGVAPKGLTSWQRMVLFHRNRGGTGLSDERRKALQDAIVMLSKIRQERRTQPELYDPDTLLPVKKGEDNTLNEVLYHGGPKGHIRTLKPKSHPRVGGERAVFATPDRNFAVSMAVPEATDEQIAVGYVGNKKKKDFYIDELQPDAFKLYNRPAWLYHTPSTGFSTDPRLMAEERISREPVRVLRREKIKNALEALRSAAGVNMVAYDDVPDSMRARGMDMSKMSSAELDRTVFSYVPTSALATVQQYGLLGGKALIRRQQALEAAAKGRGTTPEEFKASVRDKLRSWKRYQALGPNVLFQHPPAETQLAPNHPLKQHDLATIKVHIDQFLRDEPKAKVYGMELEPYDEKKHYTGNERHHYLDKDKLETLLSSSAVDLWKHYKDPEQKGYYAADVPHASIHAPRALIPPKYLELPKQADAPGIPDRDIFGDVSKLQEGQLLDYVRQSHLARRAGQHTDIRIGNPELGMFSWAARKGLPEPGGKHLAVQQPLHEHAYNKFEGTIEKGYGAGTVKKEDEGRVLITRSGPEGVHFTTAHRRFPERFALIPPRTEGQRNWLLLNTTKTQPVPYEKTKYKTIPAERAEEVLSKIQPGSSVQAKIDGAASLTQLLKDHAEVMSYRTRKDTGGPIVHTERVYHGRPRTEVPPKYRGSVLRGELYGMADDKAIEPQRLGGLLNSSVGKSIDDQRSQGIQLRNLVFDLERLGKNTVHDMGYQDRLSKAREVAQHLPPGQVDFPEDVGEAKTPEEAIKLWRQVASGKNKYTREGVVIHEPGKKPAKIKLRDEHDVHVREFFPGKGKYQNTGVGGFRYSHEPEGDIVGEVGTGLTDQLRKDMHKNPDAYLGRIARVVAQRKTQTGALYAPSLLALHEDRPTAQEIR